MEKSFENIVSFIETELRETIRDASELSKCDKDHEESIRALLIERRALQKLLCKIKKTFN